VVLKQDLQLWDKLLGAVELLIGPVWY